MYKRRASKLRLLLLFNSLCTDYGGPPFVECAYCLAVGSLSDTEYISSAHKYLSEIKTRKVDL